MNKVLHRPVKGGVSLRCKPSLWALMLCLVFGIGMARSAEAGQQASNSTTVAVNIAESIAVVAWPESLVNLASNAIPGETVISSPLKISVKANSPWGIEISCDLPDGKMKEFDRGVGAYVSDGSILTHPLEWSSSPSGPWLALSSENSAIVSSQPPTGDQGKDVQFYLCFSPDYSDQPLEEGRDYRIVLRYTAGLNF